LACVTGLAAQEQSPASPGAAQSSPSSPADRAQTPSPTTRTQATTGAEEQVTVTGCIQREADYRQATGAGRGGAVATGIGTGNEFILANAMMGAGAATGTTGSAAARPGAGSTTAGAATGTGGSVAGATAFELTGSNEGQAAAHVGKRVQVMGKIKTGEADAAGATGGPTGNIVGSQDLQLRELEVSSITETTGTCTPAR
jgi:hypothetical protein